MARTKVTMNRAEWGRQVMASASMKAMLAGLGSAVAARLPGSSVRVSDSPAAGGGRRARVRIRTSIPMTEEVETGRAQAALRAVVGSAHRSGGRR